MLIQVNNITKKFSIIPVFKDLVSWDEKLVSKKLRVAFCRRKIFKMTKMLGVFSRFQWLDFQNFCIVALEIKKEQSVMKKFLIGLVSLIVIAFVGLQIADKVVKGGDEYFVQVTTDGQILVARL